MLLITKFSPFDLSIDADFDVNKIRNFPSHLPGLSRAG